MTIHQSTYENPMERLNILISGGGEFNNYSVFPFTQACLCVICSRAVFDVLGSIISVLNRRACLSTYKAVKACAYPTQAFSQETNTENWCTEFVIGITSMAFKFRIVLLD